MITSTASNIFTETTTLEIKTTDIRKTSTRIPFKATSTTVKSTTTATPHNLTCTNDFTMVHGKCWRWFNENSSREYADQKCKWHNGATLVSIRNSEENQALSDFVKEKLIDSLWIGLYCTEWTNIDSCIWDIQAGSASNYSSFGEGYPNADIGKCVYYTVSGNNTGQWISTLCNQNMTYVCELPPTIHDSTCDFNYNGHCYSPFAYRKYVTDAQNFCASRCSNLVSIHSANENRFIQSMYPDVPYMYTLIGALAPSLDYIIWIDKSESDFNNMRQTTETPRGSCVDYTTTLYTTLSSSIGTESSVKTTPSTATPSTVSTQKPFSTSSNLSSTAVYSTTSVPRAPICTNNFTMIDGKCWKLFNHGEIRSDADKICKTYSGSTLVSIKNDDETKLLIDFVKDSHIDTLWTGLFCSNGTTAKSCFWDVQAGSAEEYSSFGTGYPNPNYGGCVYFTASGATIGKWGSAQCSQNMPFVCELPPTIIESSCKYIYNNNCYIRTDYGYTTTQAQRYCVSNCANLVSIHSGNENRFIQSMYDMSYAYILIGGLAPSKDYLIWLDGSPTDYNNLDVINPGVCVLMSLSNGSPATWYTKECGYPSWFLCKRPVGAKC